MAGGIHRGDVLQRSDDEVDLLRDDRDVLDGYRAGRADALERVYRQYVTLVEAMVRRGFIIGDGTKRIPGQRDPEVQRELVQEVFARALSAQARTRYDGLRPFRSYVLRITRNLMIDRARKLASEPERDALVIDEHDGSFELGPDTPSPEEELTWRRLRTETTRYLAGCSEEMKTFATLRYEQDLSQQSVAEVMAVSRRKVRSLEARIERGLRSHLKKLGLWPD